MQTLIVTKGELWLYGAGAAPRLIESPFAREVIERDERSRRNTSWKHAPREQSSGVIPSNTLWGSQQSAPLAPPRFLHAQFGPNLRTLYYVLQVGDSVGLFRRHLDEDREVRLFHRNGIRILGLAYSAAERRLVLAVGVSDGTAQLEVYDEDGNLKGAVTGGDSVDASPSLVGGRGSSVVFQSAGVARHAERGHLVALGHAAVCRLDWRNGQLETVLEDPAQDFVAPRQSSGGTVYAIRRPVEKPVGERASNALVDTLKAPFRLLSAVFGFLNVFTMLYGKEPLRSAGGPRRPELDQDLGRLWLHGRMIELRRVRDDPQFAGNLVPASWELVRQPPGRMLQVVAPHVAAFDVCEDESIVYTNGYDVTHWRDGQKTAIARHELVEAVAARLA